MSLESSPHSPSKTGEGGVIKPWLSGGLEAAIAVNAAPLAETHASQDQLVRELAKLVAQVGAPKKELEQARMAPTQKPAWTRPRPDFNWPTPSSPQPAN